MQEVGGDGFDVEGLFAFNVGDAVAATEVEDVELLPYLAFFDDGAVELEDAFRGQGETFGVEYLGADVAVEADEPEVGEFDDAPGGFEGGAGGEREAEFLVFVGGGDEFVSVGVDAGFDADEDVLGSPSSVAMAWRSSISWWESRMTKPTPLLTQSRRKAASLLLPWAAMRSAGNPAWRATRSSPCEAMSRERPSSLTHWTMREVMKALDA